MLAAISRAKNSKKIQPRVHVMRPAGTKRSTARMTNVTTRRLIVERHCTALTPLGLRAVLIRAKATQNRSQRKDLGIDKIGLRRTLSCSLLYTPRGRQIGKINLSVRKLWPLK